VGIIRPLMAGLIISGAVAGCSGTSSSASGICKTVRGMDKFALAQVTPGFVADLKRSDNAAFERAASSLHRSGNQDFMGQLNKECAALKD
jgi:hypothetical protein